MLETILLVLGAVIALLIILGFFISSKYAFSRTITIYALDKIVYESIYDLRNWKQWSAWSKDNDPQIELTYEGKANGVGAMMHWKGKKMGKGTAEILKADAYQEVDVTISFNKGLFKMNHIFLLTPIEKGVQIEWKVSGKTKRSAVAKLLGRTLNKWMGKDMDIALKILKNISENKSK